MKILYLLMISTSIYSKADVIEIQELQDNKCWNTYCSKYNVNKEYPSKEELDTYFEVYIEGDIDEI